MTPPSSPALAQRLRVELARERARARLLERRAPDLVITGEDGEEDEGDVEAEPEPTLVLCDDVVLPLSAVTQTFGALAVRGAGKSNLGAVLAEEFARAGLRFVAIDPVGSWHGLASGGDGRPEGGLPVVLVGGSRGDLPLSARDGQAVADLVVEGSASFVVDVSELGEDDDDELCVFLTDFARRLYRRNRRPLHVFLEEADEYAPQNTDSKAQKRLLRAWINVVRRGRARGLGCTLITQRSASINKNLLMMVENLFVLRTTGPHDVDAVRRWVMYSGVAEVDEFLETLPTLDDGECWLYSPSWLRRFDRVRIRRRRTFDSGATPRPFEVPVVPERRRIDLSEVERDYLEIRERETVQESPAVLRARVAELERECERLREICAVGGVSDERVVEEAVSGEAAPSSAGGDS